MQGQQQNGNGVSMQVVIEEYKGLVGELNHELVIMRAYIKQLEEQLKTYQDAEAQKNESNK
jgi:hypothetical protein